MTTQTFIRNAPATASLTTTPADKLIAALQLQVAAQSANASFKWKVLAFSNASPRYILLSRKDGTAGRIIIFGQNGSTPNGAAVRDTVNAGPTLSGLYMGYSPTSTATTPAASWLTGASLSDTDYSKGILIFGPTTVANADCRLNYFDSADIFGVCISSATSAGCSMAFAGKIWKDWTLADQHGVMGSGTSVIGGSWGASSSPLPGGSIGTESAMASDFGGQCAVLISGTWYSAARAFIRGSGNGAVSMEDPATKIAQFSPILLQCGTDVLTLGLIGKLNQIGYGPNCFRETTYTDTSAVIRAYGSSYSTSAANDGYWLVNADL